jgi:hypothetical protein
LCTEQQQQQQLSKRYQPGTRGVLSKLPIRLCQNQAAAFDQPAETTHRETDECYTRPLSAFCLLVVMMLDALPAPSMSVEPSAHGKHAVTNILYLCDRAAWQCVYDATCF